MGKHWKPHQKSNYKHPNKNRGSNWKGPNKNKNWNARANITTHMPRATLREDQVGITEYVSPDLEGFTAVIKSRYSDFHVNEIDVNDEVLVLDDLNVPKEEEENPLDAGQLAEIRNCFKDVVSEETWQKIDELSKAPKENEDPIQIDVNEMDKAKRAQFHALLAQVYNNRLVSSTQTITIAGIEMKFLKIVRRKGKNDGKRRKWSFPAEYVHFLVHKENMDTTEVASHISQRLHLKNSRVNFCGTKDKRAITTQKFCVKKRKPEEIVGAIKNLRNVKIGNFRFADRVLKLGDLHGNRFQIALRHVNAEQSLMERALSQLRDTGFINYYGLQRFGNCVDVPTYEIGEALMKADYKKACELILKPRSADPPFMKEIRETWWKNRDSKAASAMIRSKNSIERKILAGLAQFGENDYATAIRRLPRNLLLLYPHAFQSLIFNRIASRRIKKFGLNVIPGDLVYRDKNENPQTDAFDDADMVADDDNDADNAQVDSDDDGALANVDGTQIESEYKQKVRALTEEDISSGAFSIHDIVLPLPGYDIKYPENILYEWYKETLQEFDLTSDALNHNVKTLKMAGAYRKLFILPQNLTWEFRNYEEENVQLIWSDWDFLRKSNEEREKLSNNEGKQRALLLKFCLPTSCYATMFLRELLKIDTSSSNQVSIETKAKEQQQQEQLQQKEMELSAENNDKNSETFVQTNNDGGKVGNASNNKNVQKRSHTSSSSDSTEPESKIKRSEEDKLE